MFALLSAPMATTPAAADGCKLHKMVEFPVTMSGMNPMTTANINDVDVQFEVDSGAFYSTISAASVAQLKLKTSALPIGFQLMGVHGAADVSATTVKNFILAGVALHNVEFLAGGSEIGQGIVGLLGQNFLHIQDVEYDLGQGVVRLIRPENCGKSMLSYWAAPSTPFSMIDIVSEPTLSGASTGSRLAAPTPQLSPTFGRAYVNGVEIRVLFDTGSGTSILSLKAAARAGIKLESPGVVRAGASYGIGRESFETYLAPFSSFKIGEEEIKNTRLRIGDIEVPNADMLLGADFFLSHRIYVANSQRKMYITYNGGPVFRLSSVNRTAAESSPAASPQQADTAGAAGEDAADYSRRGAAFASRHEFDQALGALSRACELAPDNADYRVQRGLVYAQTKQRAVAMADFDEALKLKPDDLRAHLLRAQLLLQQGDNVLAAVDLDAADSLAPKGAEERYQMGYINQRADRLALAVAQFTLWIDAHPEDARLPDALNARCWLRALEGVDLTLALKDCDAALRRAEKPSAFYAKVSDSRGLVLLRMGNYDKSIADYNASLKIDAQNAWALYGRGIDELRKREVTAGDADVAKATSLMPQIAEEFKRRGMDP
jgi:tetratricopeptide (TPR) repeat protein